MATFINLTKADIDTDGTADLYIETNLSQDGIYRWIERKYVDRPYFTGWDLTDAGFMINFDMSLDCNRDSFKTDNEYKSYMRQAIKDLVPAEYKLEAAE